MPGSGFSGIDIGVLGCFFFGFYDYFVGVGVLGVEDFFGETYQGLVAGYESYV